MGRTSIGSHFTRDAFVFFRRQNGIHTLEQLVFLRMDRDPLLSRLNNSQPNKLGAAFLWRILSFGFVPIVSLLGSQFPSIREFLFSWVQPALQAIK